MLHDKESDCRINDIALCEEISEIKQYLSLIEREINSSDNLEHLSNDQVRNIWRKLRTACNFVYGANYFWAEYTNDREFRKRLVETDHKLLWREKE